MGADKYTKEEKEFYESIMREIRMHQGFGERNPVDIGIECGYSEDDVMKMIHMCQDIVEEEKQKPEIPVRENWELEGIIPFEDFVKMDFSFFKNYEPCNSDVCLLVTEACEYLGILANCTSTFMLYANDLKTKSLEQILGFGGIDLRRRIHDFKEAFRWIAIYGTIVSKIINGYTTNQIAAETFFSDEAIETIRKLYATERETGWYYPIDKMILKQNGLLDKSPTDIREEVKKRKQ